MAINKSQGQSFEEKVLFIACKKNIIFTWYGQLLYVAYYSRCRGETRLSANFKRNQLKIPMRHYGKWLWMQYKIYNNRNNNPWLYISY